MAKRQEDEQSYEEMFVEFSDQVEKILRRLLVLLAALLIGMQCLLQIPFLRLHLSRVEPLEGKPYLLQTASREAE